MKSLVAAVLLAAVGAEHIVETASFGYGAKGISFDGRAIPGWQISGSEYTPQIMSDRVVLTPPYPGRRRGALWTRERFSLPEWSANVEFRATGPDHGDGNMQIWYTNESQASIGSEDIYNVGTFDGLVLLLDQYGGRGGMLRAFLNDGTVDFKSHPHLESLAVGHCDYAYRNLGRPSRVQFKQDANGLEVLVDGTICFRSDDILLPTNNHFGLTASSSEVPDAFEVFNFVTYAADEYAREPPRRSTPPPFQAEESLGESISDDWKDAMASSILSQDARVSSLQDQLQTQTQSIDNILREVQRSTERGSGQYHELLQALTNSEQLRALERRLGAMERSLEELRMDFARKDYSGHFNDLHTGLQKKHDALMESLPEKFGHVLLSHLPNISRLIFIVVLVQILLAGSYMLYKRRRSSVSKKYL